MRLVFIVALPITAYTAPRDRATQSKLMHVPSKQ
jgi:hypothetical protein